MGLGDVRLQWHAAAETVLGEDVSPTVGVAEGARAELEAAPPQSCFEPESSRTPTTATLSWWTRLIAGAGATVATMSAAEAGSSEKRGTSVSTPPGLGAPPRERGPGDAEAGLKV